MGTDGYWSWFWSIMFVAVGILLIAGNHLVRYLLRRKKNIVNANHNCISSIIGASVIFVVSTILLVSGIILMSTNPFVQTLNFGGFNIGVVCLVVGIASYLLLIIPGINLYELKHIQKGANA